MNYSKLRSEFGYRGAMKRWYGWSAKQSWDVLTLGKKLIIGGAILLGAVMLLGFGMDLNAKSECLTWQTEAETMPDYFLTANQAEQCQTAGISVNAPVKYISRFK